LSISPNFRVITKPFHLEEAIRELTETFEKTGYVEMECTTVQTRTARQNRALHVYLRLLGEALNEAGLDQRAVLKSNFPIPWSTESAKQNLFSPIMKAMFDIDSTTKLERIQVSQVYDVLNRSLSEKYGISIPFPEGQQ
tara:strand:- start:132 stop:548 length:417 start_codon:yes stop_codon:yes gene_type:complete